ncbi:DUF7500 family protein [Halobellus rubicundus]|uniref:Uncharacterized protein n=1 Tax=Halobellus rubicundus TaxID=2996466 RepID=A0ABD5M9M9_9EURY
MAPADPTDDAHPHAREDEGVVRPDELDYTASERVAELDEGRYVVATDNDETPSVDDGDEEAVEDRGSLARQQMARYVSEQDADYGFALTAAFDGEVAHHEHFSDDVATAFGELTSWYVDQIDTDASTRKALAILLLASDTQVSYPTKALASVLNRHGLSLDDSIADLVSALRGEGLQIPSDPPEE